MFVAGGVLETGGCARGLVVPDHDQAAAVDPLVGVHDELRLARLARQKQQGNPEGRNQLFDPAGVN